MTATLYATDGSLIGPAKISDFRAWPTFLHLPALDGTHRFFMRHGSNTGDGAYDEVKPITAELIQEKCDAG